MQPGRYNHRFTAGDDYEVTVTLSQGGVPIDTTGYTFTAEIRQDYLPHGTLRGAFAVTPVAGGCRLNLTGAETRELGTFGRLVWDLQSDSGNVRTWLTGTVDVTPEVTDD